MDRIFGRIRFAALLRWAIATALAATCGPGVAPAQTPATGPATYAQVLEKLGDGLKENMLIREVHNEKTDARAKKRFYLDLWDLSDFPAYQPQQQVAGTLRISGNYLVAGMVAEQWQRDFAKFQPNVHLAITGEGTVAAGEVDIETGPRVKDRLRQASEYEAKLKQPVFEIDWCTGSYDVPGWSPGFVIFVHKDNPIAHLSMEQLDGTFGGARTGAWDGTTWRTDRARGPEKNIRTWGELGLTGEWADKPINIYGGPLKYNIQLGFERKVFQGGDVWNENTREYSHEMNPDGTRYSSSVEMVKDLSADRYGISFSDMGSAIPGARAVPIGKASAGPFYPVTLQTMRDRSYPLFLEEWAEMRLEPGKPLDPLVKEFLTFMLSREGQDAIQRDGKWLPLPAAVARAQRAKLDQLGEAVNPKQLGLQVPMIAPERSAGESPDETGKVDPRKSYYTKRWDLQDLPAYRPEQQVSGTVRIPGQGLVMNSTIGDAWMKGFAKYHPGIKFEKTSGSLTKKQVDLEMGRKWTPYFGGEYLAYQLKYKYSPTEIEIATGSYDVSGWSPAIAIYVNQDNPLAKLTVAQLDGIFGGPRRGGWVSTAWRRQVARGAEANIRTWGQLGLTGEWADKPINVYTPPLKYHIASVFERKVLQGGNMWNDSLREYPLVVDAAGARNAPSADRVDRVGRDKFGITFSSMGFGMANAKPIAVASTDGGACVEPTLESVRERSYPLYLEIYAYADRAPGKPMDPKVKEFLRYVLSREGQELLQRDGKWLPLTAQVAGLQAGKLQVKAP